MEQKYKFGLIKNEGVWNESKTRIYPNSYFEGYKPIQSVEIFWFELSDLTILKKMEKNEY